MRISYILFSGDSMKWLLSWITLSKSIVDLYIIYKYNIPSSYIATQIVVTCSGTPRWLYCYILPLCHAAKCNLLLKWLDNQNFVNWILFREINIDLFCLIFRVLHTLCRKVSSLLSLSWLSDFLGLYLIKHISELYNIYSSKCVMDFKFIAWSYLKNDFQRYFLI